MRRSRFRKIAIIAQYDTIQKKIILHGSPRRIAMLRDFYLWTHLEFRGEIVEEMYLFSKFDLFGDRELNIWTMPSYSSVYLHGAIKKFDSDVDVLIVDVMDEENKEEVLTKLKDYNPDAIFLSTTFCLRLPSIRLLLNEIRNNVSAASIMIGGHFIAKELHYTDNRVNLLEQFGLNIHIASGLFGEREVVSFLQQDQPMEGTELIWIDGDGRRYECSSGMGAAEFENSVVNYKGFPFCERAAPVRTVIGCPFHCAFCSYHQMAGKLRLRDIELVVQELQTLDAMGVKHVVFIDDTVNIPKNRFLLLLDSMIDRKLTNFHCYSFCRCQFVDDEVAKKMARCGFKSVLLGIESGSEEILVNMNKNAKPNEYLAGIEKLKKNGIATFGAIIIGFPGETEDTINTTIDFVNSSGLDFVYVQPYFYLHNSPVYEDRDKYLLRGEGPIWKHQTMNSKDCNTIVKNIFDRIDGPLHTHLENTMWEFVYLSSVGFSLDDYRLYRTMINNIRSKQIAGDWSSDAFIEAEVLRFKKNRSFVTGQEN
ncbi:MAG: radical SAM protein [Desulfovibrionaceae bacterium]